MIVKYVYGYKNGNKRKPSSLVSCDDCKAEREVVRSSSLKDEGNRHRCASCHGKYRSKALHSIRPHPNLEKQSPFKGKLRGSYKEPMTTFYIDSSGYKQIWCGKQEGSRGRKDGYRAEHHLVAEDLMGRALLPGEVVHHLDGDKLNNSPENLHVCSSQKEHRSIHGQLERVSMDLVKSGVIVWDGTRYRVIES